MRGEVHCLHLPSLTRESLFPEAKLLVQKKLIIVPATLVATTKLMCQFRQTIFSISTVSILTIVSLLLFDVLRLVAVGIAGFEGF